jgi:hypothetical protein
MLHLYAHLDAAAVFWCFAETDKNPTSTGKKTLDDHLGSNVTRMIKNLDDHLDSNVIRMIKNPR